MEVPGNASIYWVRGNEEFTAGFHFGNPSWLTLQISRQAGIGNAPNVIHCKSNYWNLKREMYKNTLIFILGMSKLNMSEVWINMDKFVFSCTSTMTMEKSCESAVNVASSIV